MCDNQSEGRDSVLVRVWKRCFGPRAELAWVVGMLCLAASILSWAIYQSFAPQPLAFGDVSVPFFSVNQAVSSVFNYWTFQGGGSPASTLLYSLFVTLPVAVMTPAAAQLPFLFLPFLIAGISTYFLARLVGVSRQNSVAVGLVFSVNAVTLTYLIVGSSMDSLMPMSFAPAVVYFLVRCTHGHATVTSVTACALAYSAGSWWNPQFTFWMIPIALPVVLAFTDYQAVAKHPYRPAAFLALFLILFVGLSFITNFTFAGFLTAYFRGGTVGNDLGTPAQFAAQVQVNFSLQLHSWVLFFDFGLVGLLFLYVSGVENFPYRSLSLYTLTSATILLGVWFFEASGSLNTAIEYVPPIAAFEPWPTQLIVGLLVCTALLPLLGVRPRLATMRGSQDSVPIKPPRIYSRLRLIREPRLLLPAFAVFLVLQACCPLVAGGLSTPPIAEVIATGTGISAAQIPSAVSEFRAWIDNNSASDPLSGYMWAPLNPYVYSALEYALPQHPALLPKGYLEEAQYITPLTNVAPAAAQWSEALASAGIEYVVVMKSGFGTSSPLFNSASSYLSWRQGPIQAIASGPEWNLVFYPGGSPANWTTELSHVSTFTQVLTTNDLAVYRNDAYRGALEAFATNSTSFNMSSLFVLPSSLATSSNISFQSTAFNGSLTNPLQFTGSNEIPNPLFLSNGSGWLVHGQSSNATVEFANESLTIATKGSGSAAVSVAIPVGSDLPFVFTVKTATMNTNGSRISLEFLGTSGNLLGTQYPDFFSTNYYAAGELPITIIWLGTSPEGSSNALVTISSMGGANRGELGLKNVSSPSLRILRRLGPETSPDYNLGLSGGISVQLANNNGTLLVLLTAYNSGWNAETLCSPISAQAYSSGVRTVDAFFIPAKCGSRAQLGFSGTQAWHLVGWTWITSLLGVVLAVSVDQAVRWRTRGIRIRLWPTRPTPEHPSDEGIESRQK